MSPTFAPPELRFNIADGLLQGRIDGVSISAYAVSGGRAGSKTPGALNGWLANNPYATHVKMPDNKQHPGGPLPMGRYRVVPHESRPNMLRLMPTHGTAMHGRDGMLIHGRGPRGSDGCIVPTDFADVIRLCKLVRRRHDSGGPDVILEVVAIGQNLDRQMNTA